MVDLDGRGGYDDGWLLARQCPSREWSSCKRGVIAVTEGPSIRHGTCERERSQPGGGHMIGNGHFGSHTSSRRGVGQVK